MPIQFKRLQSTPVLAKGSTYDGWTADAIASPSACWDGSQYVMAVSMWSIANSQWSSAFFTSSDLVTWSYVSGSNRPPTGSNYILGNGAIVWWQSKYWYAYTAYPSGMGTYATVLDHSTDLLTWTNVSTSVTGGGGDPRLVVNPTSGNLELWSINSSREVIFADSPDGSTWTSHGVYLTSPAWNNDTSYFGSSGVFYDADGTRYCMPDILSGSSYGGPRMKALFASPGLNITWTTNGTCLGPNEFNAWESQQVFDNGTLVQSGPWDRSDGRGPQLWMLYAGGDNVSPTDNTDSSIGLAFAAPAPSGGTFPVDSDASVVLTAVASEALLALASGSSSVVMTAVATAVGLTPTPPSPPVIAVTFRTPYARIYNLDTMQLVDVANLAHLRYARVGQVYSLPLRLTTSYPVGRYGVLYQAPVDSFVGVSLSLFEVVAGGDAAGAVIAAYTVAESTGDLVLGQLGSGAVVVGQKPGIS